MADVNPILETLILVSLSILLPTIDVYSDLALITKLYNNDPSHPNWASSLLVPFLLNYTLCWIAWFTTEKQKKFTWIAALLGCYPQLVAARIIWLFWTQPAKGVKEKKHLERNLMENEIFTEAVPSALIMTFLMVVVRVGWSEEGRLIIGEHGSPGYFLFLVSFSTSVLSAGLGLAKCLKVGPCRVLAEGGCLGGLLAPRFLLIFASCLLALLGKGLALASPFSGPFCDEQKVQVIATILSTMFLPGLLLGLISCWHRGILKTIISHPSIVLLPAFTQFTFTSSNKWCKEGPKEEGKEEGEDDKARGGEAEEPFIVFSPKFTLLNLLLNLIAHVAYSLSMTHIAGYMGQHGLPQYLIYYLLYGGLPITILGVLLTFLSVVLTSTRQTCCSRSNCCCTCFALPRVEYGALLPSKPHAPFVLDANGKPKRVLEEEEVAIEETEMVANEEAKKIEKQEDEMVELVDNQAEDNLDIDMV